MKRLTAGIIEVVIGTAILLCIVFLSIFFTEGEGREALWPDRFRSDIAAIADTIKDTTGVYATAGEFVQWIDGVDEDCCCQSVERLSESLEALTKTLRGHRCPAATSRGSTSHTSSQ